MANNVTAAKPVVGGAVSFAPYGTPLPASASATLDAAFKKLGYISDDGLVNSDNKEQTDVVAWGGDEVASLSGTHTDTFKFKLIEALNEDVLAFVYGAGNVDVTEATTTAGKKVKVTSTSDENDYFSLVADMILTDGVKKRIVISKAQITELGDITYKDNEVSGFDVTVKAFGDGTGETHHELLEFPLED